MSEAPILWRHARLATCVPGGALIGDGAMITRGERIEWVGETAALPRELDAGVTLRDLGGRWVTPALIDCHTHLVFAGTRAAEYAERLRGVSYEEIARRGGGILTTVRATREASEEQLLAASAPRLHALLVEGVTTVEIKSGYGLTFEDERKMLRVARELGRRHPVSVRTTFLGAHALPPEYAGRADDYIDTIADDWLPRLAREGLVDAVDVFCDSIGFTSAQSARLFDAARALGLPVKMHAEQLANLGGSRLAARYGALSCDHLEYTKRADLEAMREAGTVAVLLPVAWYCLADPNRPPVPAMRDLGLEMAVATDCNPGSAPGASLQLALGMAVRLFGLLPGEALGGATRAASRALGLHGERGTLEPGRAADFAVWDIETPDELGYWVGFNPCRAVVRAGELAQGALPEPPDGP